jgi:hypothetical protein
MSFTWSFLPLVSFATIQLTFSFESLILGESPKFQNELYSAYSDQGI